ncbi:hypothetical protein ACXOL9_004059 [Vibrio parahaemolyticus]|nr:hypothetical protein [Vibrio parahaemolyticus]EMC9391300.1 hypothetical protein [Vibrio parahaemolyticus]
MTDSNAMHSTITKQSKATKFSNLESKAASKDEGFNTTLLMAHSQVKAMRNDVKEPISPVIKLQPSLDRNGISERLQHLKMFSRGKSPEQKSDMTTLKNQGLPESIKAQFPELGHRAFYHHEIYEFLLELDSRIEMGEWFLRENAQEVIVYASYGSVFPGLRFQKRGETYHCMGFNFDIRLAS